VQLRDFLVERHRPDEKVGALGRRKRRVEPRQCLGADVCRSGGAADTDGGAGERAKPIAKSFHRMLLG